MDDQVVGLSIRRIRVRRRLRQVDVATLAGVSRSTVSDLERGLLDRVGLRRVRSIARAVEARIDLDVRGRGANGKPSVHGGTPPVAR